jgi:hypothetical protein
VDPTGAPEIEIEVTPEMIEAGVRVLLNSAAFDGEASAARELVRRIYESGNFRLKND